MARAESSSVMTATFWQVPISSQPSYDDCACRLTRCCYKRRPVDLSNAASQGRGDFRCYQRDLGNLGVDIQEVSAGSSFFTQALVLRWGIGEPSCLSCFYYP